MKKIAIFVILIMVLVCTPETEKFTLIKTGSSEMVKRIGETFDIMVSIENATDVVGLSTWITYDPAIVEVVDNDPNTPLTQVIYNEEGFFQNPSLQVAIQNDGTNETAGVLICGYTSIPPVLQTGTGNAFSVRFRAIAEGATDIQFDVGNTHLQDLDGDVPVNLVNDSVEVPVNATLRITVI